MPGIELRIAASMTVAPFSTSMMRVSPEWSTKWILAMFARTAGKRVRQTYNGSIPSALVGIWRLKTAVSSGLAQDLGNGALSIRGGVIEFVQGISGSEAGPDLRLEMSGRSAECKGADRPRRPLERVRQRRRSGRKRGKRFDETRGLGGKHGQHFALERRIAQRHAPQMRDIDRAVIGGERWRWHPFNPVQMKRHGKSESFVSRATHRRGRPRERTMDWLTDRSVLWTTVPAHRF